MARRASGTFFPLFNDLVDGHLAALGHTELKVLLIILRHADKEGIAYPGVERIAKLAGIQPRNAYNALASLAKKGYVESVGGSGGRAKSTRRRVRIPETLAPKDRVSGTENPATGDQETLTKSTTTPDADGTETMAQAIRGTDQGTTNQTDHQQCLSGGDDDFELTREKSVRLALLNAEVTEPVAIELARNENLYPIDVHLLVDESQGKDTPAGWIVTMLRTCKYDVPRSPLDPKVICRLINECRLYEVDGIDVLHIQDAGHNRFGVHIFDSEGRTIKVIAPDRLRREVIL